MTSPATHEALHPGRPSDDRERVMNESLRRTDTLLTELVELVETARTLPMSSSAVLPREHVLDLLDELREVMPPEIEAARSVIAHRDTLLHEAFVAATATRDEAAAQADAILADADHRAAGLLQTAEEQAAGILQAARIEHAQLVSVTGVHAGAAQAAATIRQQADDYQARVRGEADRYATELRLEAERYCVGARREAEGYATTLATDAEAYADRTLSEMVDALERAAATAGQGRAALAQRRARSERVPPESLSA